VAAASLSGAIDQDSFTIRRRRRFPEGDAYFTALSREWSDGVRQVFRELPDLEW
jgi:putative proteasome-type protease